MAAADLLPKMFVPGARYWIIGPTYTLGEKEFRYLWEDIIMTLGLGRHVKRKAYNERTGEMFIEMPWGTRVDVKSADHPDGLVGEGLDGVIMSEAAKQKKSTWEKYVRPALADKHGWASFPSTPEGYNWYYDLYTLGKDTDYPEYESWNFPSWENPYVYPDGFEDSEIQSQLRRPDDPWFWQEIGADFRSFVGKIYDEWSDEKHILQEYAYKPEWPNYNFFDFGFANPFVCLDVQISPSDDIYIWREYYVSERPVHIHARYLSERANPPGYAIACGFGDAADPGAVETLGMLYTPVYADNDAKDVQRGIQEVKKFLTIREDDKPRLFVHKSCVNTIFEFQNYRMKQALRDDEDKKEEPKKWADHAVDAIRYGIMHLYVLGARYHLEDVQVSHISEEDAGPKPPQEEFVEIEPDLVGGKRSSFTRSESSVFTMSGRSRW